MIRIFTLLAVFLWFQSGFSQTKDRLKESKHIYIHGNSVLVGNNSLGHHATKPMLEDDVPNDAVKMKYIDVDQDKKTFSSSEASISGIPENSRVVYAVLYWSALYPYEKGNLRTTGGKTRFIGKGERSTDFNQILFQTPGNKYRSVLGTVLKDGHEQKEFKDTSPYVCRADVTEFLQALSSANGTYAVGNIRAAEGRVSGGGSAGWLLYVVYENEEESLKYFTTYDGLIEVDKEVVDLKFSGFKSKQEGKINPTFGIGALEGDRKIRSDQMLLYSKKNDEFIAMGNALREERNFFNSSITMGNSIFQDRNPNSSNTLGFDLLKFDIPNENNDFFDENTTDAVLRFQTRADRFYLFFVSFEIDMDRDYLEFLAPEIEKTDIVSASIKPGKSRLNSTKIHSLESEANDDSDSETDKKEQKEQKKDSSKTEKRSISSKSEQEQTSLAQHDAEKNIQDKKTLSKTEQIRDNESKLHLINGDRKARYPNLSTTEAAEIKDDILNQENRIIPGLPAGYYLVTNVFAVRNNAKRWREFLIEKEYTPSTFLNPENDWEYIYIDSFDNLDDGFEVWKQHQDKEYFVGLWLMKINMETADFAFSD